MTKALLPQSFWFRVAATCPRVEEIPRRDPKKPLVELPPAGRLPEGARLEGRSPWAEVRVGWNPGGLGVLVQADGLGDPKLNPDRPEGFADVQLWVDTRDTRDVSRATRFCHRFAASIRLQRPGRNLVVEVAHKPIARAVADPPLTRAGQIESAPELLRDGWTSRSFCPHRCSTASTPRPTDGSGSPTRSPTTSARPSSSASAATSRSARTRASGRRSS